MDALPEELLLNILYRLPLKSIRSCLRVNKNFLSVIKNPSFFPSYTKIRNKENYYLLFWRADRGHFELRHENNSFDLYRQFNLPVDDHSRDIPNCNGMLCLHSRSDLILWNPTIQKTVTLPTSNLISNLNCYSDNIAFWFDSLTNDYKLIRIFTPRGRKPRLPQLVEIFSLNNNQWKDLSRIAPNFLIEDNSPPVFLNGKLNWIGCPRRYGGDTGILTFDVNAQVFGTIELPYILRKRSRCLNLLSYKETSIAVRCLVYDTFGEDIYDPRHAHAEVWVMKEYGNVESWTNLWDYDTSQELPLGAVVEYGRCFPWARGLGLLNNGEVLWELCGSMQPDVHAVDESEMVISTDPETGVHKKVAVFPHDYFSHARGVTYFEESVALLDNA